MLRARTGRELARWLEISTPQNSRRRPGSLPVTATLLANLLEATDAKPLELQRKVGQTPGDWPERVKAETKKQD